MDALKIQFELLDEIAQNASMDTPAELDLSDLNRKTNFFALYNDGCLKYSEAGDLTQPSRLSEKGYAILRELTAMFRHEEFQQRLASAAEGANIRATWMMLVSIICALISLPSWKPVLIYWFGLG